MWTREKVTHISPVNEIMKYSPADVMQAIMKGGMSTPLPRMTSKKIKYYRGHFRELLGTFSKPDLEMIINYLKIHTNEKPKPNSIIANKPRTGIWSPEIGQD